MKKCDFCGGMLERRVEKRFVESYQLDDKSEVLQDAHISDVVVDLNVYNYCSDCDIYMHEELFLDGRNTLAINLKLLKDKAKKEINLSLIDIFEKMNLIYFTGSEVLVLYRVLQREEL